MKYIIFFFVALLFSSVTVLGQGVTEPIEQHISNDKSKPKIRVCTVMDKSSSITDQANYASEEDLCTLIEFIVSRSGELALATIGSASKKTFLSFRSVSDNAEKPSQRFRAETPMHFKSRIIRWRDSRKPKTDKQIQEFLKSKAVQQILDYTRLEDSSDVVGGLDLAIRYLHQDDRELRNAKNIALLVTDGRNTGRLAEITKNSKATILVVHRSADIGILSEYVKPGHIFITFESAVRFIIDNF